MKSVLLGGRRINSALFHKINLKSLNHKPCFSTVAENTINIVFVDEDGNRATVPGRVGQTLLEVAKRHNIDLPGFCNGGGADPVKRRTDKWVEITYGSGPSCFYCHVKIPSKYNDILPEVFPFETKGLMDLWEEEYSSSSRLACSITLDKRHDGMLVLVPDAPLTDFA